MFKVIQIARMRINRDGEGVRTLVITEGCNLQCRYCFNKRTWDGSLKYREMSAKQLYDEVAIDRLYFLATEGGVTFGGGEPLLYAEEIAEFHKLCNGEFTIYAETSLNVSANAVETASNCIDRFIVDIKATDSKIYNAYTGGRLETALENLQRLLELVGKERILVRIPVIPDMTSESDQEKSREELIKLGLSQFDLFTYHCL